MEVKYEYQDYGYVGAVDYWVGKVNNYGDWDYKRLPGFVGQSFTCEYGANDSKRALHDSEWIGNYNYGYTGHLMFSYPVLQAGSIAVAGFDVQKDKSDWPAIQEGYNDSGNIEW